MDLAPLLLSFEIAIVASVVAGVVGIAIAALLANVRFPGRDLLEVLVTAPMVMPPTVLGYYVLVALGRRSFLGHAFEAVFGSPIVFTKLGAVIAAVIGAIPLVVRSARAALEAVDRSLVFAARTLGAGPLRAFLTIEVPLARRGIVAALLLAFVRSLGDFGVTLMVAGDIPGVTRTAALAIYDAWSQGHERDTGTMIGILTAVVFVVLYVVGKLTSKERA